MKYDLSGVHAVNLKLLKEIDRICRKYKIKYALEMCIRDSLLSFQFHRSAKIIGKQALADLFTYSRIIYDSSGFL